jgi:hypothetical protein
MMEMIRSHYKDFGQNPPSITRARLHSDASDRRPVSIFVPSSGSEDHYESTGSPKRLSGVDIHRERDVDDRTDTDFDDEEDVPEGVYRQTQCIVTYRLVSNSHSCLLPLFSIYTMLSEVYKARGVVLLFDLAFW